MYIQGRMPPKRSREEEHEEERDDVSFEDDEHEESCTVISSQQRIQEQLEWLSAAARKGPTNERKEKLLQRLTKLQEESKRDSFLTKLKDSYEKPLQEALTLGTIDEVKLLLDYNERGFRNGSVVSKDEFDKLLLHCLKEMVSATSYYLQLGFKAFYNRSYTRFILGSACTVIELQIAYDTLMYLTNMTVYTVTLTAANNLKELTQLFAKAYSQLRDVDITAFLKYIGYSGEDIEAILIVITKLTRAQLGYILKGLFIKAIRWISKKEAPPRAADAAAAAAAPPAPEPESFMDYLKTGRLFSLIRVPSFYAIIGEPGNSIHDSIETGLLDKFVSKVAHAEQGIEVQLDRAFPGQSGDIKTHMLLMNLLGLGDEAFNETPEGKEAYDVKCHMFLQKLKACLVDRLKIKSPEDANDIFSEIIPGINDGITEEQIQIAYGISTGPATDSMHAEPGSQSSQRFADVPASGWIRGMMDSWFTQVTKFVKDKKQCAKVLLGIPERAAAPPSASLGNLPHVVSILNDRIVSLLREMPDDLTREQKNEIKTRFERIFDTYKKTLCVIEVGHGDVKILLNDTTRPPMEWKEQCKELYVNAKGSARSVVNELYSACFSGGIDIMECVYHMGMNPVLAGNNVFAGSSSHFDAVMRRIEKMKERNLQMIEDRNDAENHSDEESDAVHALIGLSESRRRSRSPSRSQRRSHSRSRSVSPVKSKTHSSSRTERTRTRKSPSDDGMNGGKPRRKSLKRGKKTHRAGRKHQKWSGARARRNSTRNHRGRE